ncbi:FAD-dependent 5-carboxymethylaminomethyl-2-thiouridine(34) oxidoreductase MnmC [Variovorax sp. OV329]|uniref:FAD-dependent 5-carboxymethylaminomethyl-2-thiouridine(34) oxidoreductase MnmC n=1 Tax=Variovorax sp. OV329 TaxID=1882825 RepID=UPI0008EE70BF|nr:FAD-dependent 5-carboxymethylaminomethyl-2-thiouridine(34) oxidoreductase MnmC [Variovorax sp. OV329]SFN12217.1 tRNA 5-methylaminomethyl-2-thiouridine biosynthesis bifunctional protein [Variovorax sp. OV329]
MSAAEPLHWRADGVPHSPRFQDIYHSESGALAQARHVFLGGCGLPEAWAGRAQWRILETGFGLGLNFLTSWQAWRGDPSRPGLLHFVSVEAYPVAAEDIVRAAGAYPELAPLAKELAGQWNGLLPGFHRLGFESGRVLLTLCIGDVKPMLKSLGRFEADSIFLDGFAPDRNPEMWSLDTVKGVSRFARRGTRVATWTVARELRDALAQTGYQAHKLPGLPPKRDRLEGVFEPSWTLRRPPAPPEQLSAAGHCVVIGAGLAGAAVSASLARRGWQVTVLDAAGHPAAGASALPVGLLAPHVSPDDALLSRLTRAGIRATWQQLADLLVVGQDWADTGVLERREAGDARLPATWAADGPNESWQADAARLRANGLDERTIALWHARAGWVRPARLVSAWLSQPGIRVLTGMRVESIGEAHGQWLALDAAGQALARGDRLVIAAGYATHRFTPALPLQPVRGQVMYGHGAHGLPPSPVNGDGHLIANVPDGIDSLWLAGSTYDRDSSSTALREEDTHANLERVARLHPAALLALQQRRVFGQMKAWAGVRCAPGDRRPLVGPADPAQPQGPWVCTALGSRGLSFAALCAELLAAHWHGEPLPLPAAAARALDTRRLQA